MTQNLTTLASTLGNLLKKNHLKLVTAESCTGGAVSAEVAREMAEGALKNSHADLSVAITGIAGPDGGSTEKPVGTVWIAYAGKNKTTEAYVEIHPGDREAVRNAVIATAIQHLTSTV
jgi:nicotinamide-nucleotide amidase